MTEPFISLAEHVEVEPHPAGYRQFNATGRTLAVKLLSDGGLDCKVTSGHVELDASARRELTDWLNAVAKQSPVEAVTIRSE